MLSFAGEFTETEMSKTDIEIRREYQSMYILCRTTSGKWFQSPMTTPLSVPALTSRLPKRQRLLIAGNTDYFSVSPTWECTLEHSVVPT